MSSLDLAYYSFRTGTPNHALQRTEAAMGPFVLVELDFASLCR
jgi:hypothetical protein